MSVKPIPEGYHTVTPYMILSKAEETIEFLRAAFHATVHEMMKRPDGGIMHAELMIGNSMIMLAAAMENFPAQPASYYLYLSDVDATYQRAIEAGGVSVMEPADQFYGDRHGGVKDPSGNTWWIATHIEDVPPDEMKRRAKKREEERSAV